MFKELNKYRELLIKKEKLEKELKEIILEMKILEDAADTQLADEIEEFENKEDYYELGEEENE